MNTSKAKVAVSTFMGKVLSITGYGLGILTLLPMIAGTLEDGGTVAAALVMLAVFVFIGINGTIINRRIKRFKTYVSLISGRNMTSVENLAASTSKTEDYVRKDLQKLIDKKFFRNATVDAAANEIVIGKGVAQMAVTQPAPQVQTPSEYAPVQAQAAAPKEMTPFKCTGCGAMGTKPKGGLVECDYCGAVN